MEGNTACDNSIGEWVYSARRTGVVMILDGGVDFDGYAHVVEERGAVYKLYGGLGTLQEMYSGLALGEGPR